MVLDEDAEKDILFVLSTIMLPTGGAETLMLETKAVMNLMMSGLQFI